MINLSETIPYTRIIGRILRLPLRLVPQGMVMTILQGRLKGKKWIAGSSDHGCWLGCYEYKKQALFAGAVTYGSVVYDIGAHAGFYTLLAAELVRPGGKVVAFEPLPRNIYYLKKHLQLNRCSNVLVLEAAVAEDDGFTLFEEGKSSSTGRVSLRRGGGGKVQTVSIDALVTGGKAPPPDLMKIDVEGAEMLALSGASTVIRKYHPVIFLATHGKDIHHGCCEFLTRLGYGLQSIDNRDISETDEIYAMYNERHK